MKKYENDIPGTGAPVVRPRGSLRLLPDHLAKYTAHCVNVIHKSCIQHVVIVLPGNKDQQSRFLSRMRECGNVDLDLKSCASFSTARSQINSIRQFQLNNL